MESLNYNDFKEMVEEHLLDFFPEIDNKSITIYEAMKYSLLAGGKRLRPCLLLAACDFCGGDVKAALPYACAIEYIHTYSLIHDDLPAMDNDDLRRGNPTNHKVFGEAIAILAGDGLLHTAFESMGRDMMLYYDDPEELKKRAIASYELARWSGVRGMVAGQVADIEAVDKQCSKEMLDYIHINKTAALIIGPIRAGAALGNADDKTLADLTEFAECLGLAFQIKDDILDIEGDAAVLGKNVHHDAEGNKSTYPALYGIEASHQRLDELTNKAIEIMAPYYDNAEVFVKLAMSLKDREN